MGRYRKNVKRIDPRYFLHETVDRNDDGSAFEEPETVSVGGDIEGFQQPEEEEDTSNVAALLGTAEGTLLARMLAREILDRFGTFEELATAFPQIPRDRLSAQWVAAIKHNPMYGSSGLKEGKKTALREENLPFNAGDVIQYRPISNPNDGPYNAVVDEVEYKPGHWLGRDVEQLRSGRWKISSTARHGRGVSGPYDLVVGVHPDNDEDHIGF